jgi:hypothetical protein
LGERGTGKGSNVLGHALGLSQKPVQRLLRPDCS